ncbi:MAG: GNAT family protein, partial [Pirellulales bacterium]|nr:GNAT family protein [Pirellulales bacterium]
ENLRLIGFCSLTDIDYQSSNAQFGIMIGDTKFHGQGVGPEALAHTVEYAFKSLNLHRIYVVVRGTNDRAAKLFNQAGFKREGVMREHYYVNGHYEDVIIMSLLKIDHPSLSK